MVDIWRTLRGQYLIVCINQTTIISISQGEEREGDPGPAVDLQERRAENDPPRVSPHQTGRRGFQSEEFVQGRRASDPLHQQHPGETGGASGEKAGGGNSKQIDGFSTGFILEEELNYLICLYLSFRNYDN